ncbi:hypothetical protein ACFHYQ_17215 [Sphaerimonospora cavernae]|uniref:DUF3592 domain-containing protein n=1 Tax=Sphaerimonospora cavernae TaxID=1740611 RepID=A0ABV6U6G3_9ACTN
MREPYRIVGLWVRVILLVVLLWGGLVTVLSETPRDRAVADFQAALRTGRVTYVIYKGDNSHLNGLRWSTSPLLWYRLTDPWNLTYTKHDLQRELSTELPNTARAGPVVRDVSAHNNRTGLFPGWPFRVPVPHLSWTVRFAWIVTFLIMLGTARPRIGNRWAWFWLFTVGQIGAVMFLFSEPRPLSYGLEPQRSAHTGQMGGGQGCAMAIGLSFVVSVIVAWALAGVVHTLLDMLAFP